MKFPSLTTDRFLLRQFNESDLDIVYKGLSHPENIKYYSISYSSREAAKEQLTWFSNLENTGTGIWWAVCSPDNKTFFGAGGFNDLSTEHKKAEVGFWLFPDFWRQGIMMEVMPVICNYGFTNMGLHRIEGLVETGNIACKKTMSKLTFNHEGTMRDCEIKNGKFISLDIYAKIKNEEFS